MAEYIKREDALDAVLFSLVGTGHQSQAIYAIRDVPTADVVEVDTVSEQIIRKKAEVGNYWQNDVKQYRAMQGYSNIEHDVDNFLRGYNEAVEDMLTILDGTLKERGE